MKIEFKEDYAVFKKGDTIELDGMISSSLIRRGKAKEYKPKPKKAKSKKS